MALLGRQQGYLSTIHIYMKNTNTSNGMNNLLISIIRFGVIVSIALFVFVGEVFAAPVLTPVVATTLSATSVTLAAMVLNPVLKNTPVWFEWGEAGSAMVRAGLTSVYNQGRFETRIINLKPGVTYSFRAVAMDMESNITVYSPTASFVAQGGVVVPTSSTKKGAESEANKKVIMTPVVMGSTNRNLASVMGVGGGIFPNTLIGWTALMVMLLFVVLLVRMMMESNEKNKKARKETKASRLKVETQEIA